MSIVAKYTNLVPRDPTPKVDHGLLSKKLFSHKLLPSERAFISMCIFLCIGYKLKINTRINEVDVGKGIETSFKVEASTADNIREFASIRRSRNKGLLCLQRETYSKDNGLSFFK